MQSETRENDTGNIAVVLSGQIARSIQSVDIILSDVATETKGARERKPQMKQMSEYAVMIL